MKKDKLRPVEFVVYKNPTDAAMHLLNIGGHGPEILNGYFHCWESNGNNGTSAVIEKLDGEVVKIIAADIKFTDRIIKDKVVVKE